MRTEKGPIVALTAVFVVMLALLLWARDNDPSASGDGTTLISRLFRAGGSRRQLSSVGSSRRKKSARNQESSNSKDTAKAEDAVLSCTIVGKILDEEEKPVKDAKVTVRLPGASTGKSFESDKDGTFRADAIMPGTYDILVGHPKFVTLIRPGFPVQGTEPIEMEFRLPLGAKINGLIVDEEGKPITDVKVAARRHKMEQLKGGSVYLDDATYKTHQTDKAGTFTLTGVALGANLFEFRRPGYEFQSKVIDIRPEKAGDQMKITLKKTGQISGVVLNDFKQPLSTTTIYLTRYKPFGGKEEKLEKSKYTVKTDAEGKFVFKKLFNEGFYDILVEHDEYAPGLYPLVSVGTDKLTCVLNEGGRIEGKTQFIDRPTTEASVLLVAQAVIKGTTFTREIKSEGNGQFAFSRMPFGKYKLAVVSTGFASEPKADLACERNKPLKDVLIEVYETCIVKGRVSDSQTDKAVPWAQVSITASYGPNNSKSRKFETRADPHGVFQFHRVPGGIHVVQANARSYLRTVNDRSQQKFSLEPGEKKTDLALLLDHGGSVEGYVLDKRGRSVDGADVQLFSAVAGRGPDMKSLKARTDTTGYFQIWGIDVGERLQLYASVRRKGFAKTRSELVTLTAKQPDGSVQVVLEPGNTVSGRVTDERKFPVSGAEIKLTSHQFPNDPSSSVQVVHTKSDGSYVAPHCTPGNVTVAVSRSGFIKQQRDVAVKVEKPSDDVDFALETGTRIRGKVASLDGKPIGNAKVRAVPLEGARGTDDDITDKRGEFVLNNLGPGAFQLEATFKLSTQDGELSFRFVNPKVYSGSDAAYIDCDLGNAAIGTVKGEDNSRVANFHVSLTSHGNTTPPQDFTFNFGKSYSAAGGSFRVLNAPRGVYSLKVTADGYEPYENPDVYIGPHKTTRFPTVELKPAGGVTGTVVSSSTGKPVNAVTVRLLDPELLQTQVRKVIATATSNYEGTYRVATAKPGYYVAEFDHPSYMGARLENVSVMQKKVTDLGQITLEAGGAIQGSIVDESGDPVPSMPVSVSGIYPPKITHTDAGGNYLLQGVRPGRWAVVARGQLNSRQVYAFTTVGIEPDETEQANFRLETSAHLDGFMTASVESGIQSGKVRLHPYDENAMVIEDIHYDATVKAQKFSVSSIPPGQYFLWVTGLGAMGSYTIWQNLFLNRGENSTYVNVPGGVLRGRAKSVSNEVLAGIGLQLFPLNNLRVSQSLYNSLIRTAFSRQDGSYQFAYMQPGSYQLLYQDPGNSNWVAMPPVTVGEGQVVPNYDIYTAGAK